MAGSSRGLESSVFSRGGAAAVVPERLAAAGYRTGAFVSTVILDGKFGLDQGFDHYFGIPYSNDMQRDSLEDGRRVVPLLRDDQVADLLEDEGQRRVTREYTQEAVKFIESNKTRPFFLYLPQAMPHKPLAASEDFYTPETPGDLYADVIRELDWSTGEIIRTLKELEILDKEFDTTIDSYGSTAEN